MPPGSAESLPPSNAKPYTPSLSNGVSKPARDGATLLTSSLGPVPAPAMSDPEQPQPYAHKHFKKRYLAAADPSSVSPGSGSSSGGTPPSPSVGAGVSPEAADACEALLELGRTQEAGPRTTSRSSNESSSGSETARSRGSPSDSQPLQSLREAVWTKVATNFRKQVNEKLQEPPKDDSPMNLSANAPAPVSQCTIRGQQIIEHIIENILDKPMEGQACVPCEPINVSVNNNQEEGIKASIYESLKNDLLKGKTQLMTSSKSAPCTPPGSVSTPSGSQSKNSLPTTKPSPLPQLVPITQSTKLPLGAVHKMTSVTSTVSSHSAPNSATPSPSASSSASSSTPATLSPNSITPSGPQDVLRLLARSSQLPLSCPLPVGNSAITITKTPRVSQPHHIPSTVASVSPTPVSVSLTRTGSNQVFNLGPALTNGGPSSGSVTSIAGVPMVFTSQPGMVLTTGGHGPGPGSVVLTGLAGHGGQPGECVLLSPAGPGASQTGAGVILQQAMGGALHQGQVVIAPAGGQPLLIPAGSKLILTQPPPVVPGTSPRPGNSTNNSHSSPVVVSQDHNSSDPVNLTVAKLRPHPEAGNNRDSASSNLLSVSPGLATLKRPASLSDGEEEDIRRSARQTKGKKYQEFIEEGRINVNSRPKRRSHRSGDEDEAMDTVEPLHQAHADTKLTTETQPSTQTSTGMNHWKKKMRTVSLGETQSMTSTASITGSTGQHERLRTHQLSNKVSLTREPEPESARHHQQSSRSTRQHSHHNPHPGPQPSRGAFDVKLGNKKLRGEKISH